MLRVPPTAAPKMERVSGDSVLEAPRSQFTAWAVGCRMDATLCLVGDLHGGTVGCVHFWAEMG